MHCKKTVSKPMVLVIRGMLESWRRQDFGVGHQSKRQERASRNQDVRNFTQIQKEFSRELKKRIQHISKKMEVKWTLQNMLFEIKVAENLISIFSYNGVKTQLPWCSMEFYFWEMKHGF